MPFLKLLKDVVEKIDAKGALLLDWEGETVVHYGKIDEYDLKVIGAYQVIILNHLKSVHRDGGISFFQMKFSSVIAQFMPVNKDYYVLILFENRELAPKALYNLMNVVEIFAKEIG